MPHVPRRFSVRRKSFYIRISARPCLIANFTEITSREFARVFLSPCPFRDNRKHMHANVFPYRVWNPLPPNIRCIGVRRFSPNVVSREFALNGLPTPGMGWARRRRLTYGKHNDPRQGYESRGTLSVFRGSQRHQAKNYIDDRSLKGYNAGRGQPSRKHSSSLCPGHTFEENTDAKSHQAHSCLLIFRIHNSRTRHKWQPGERPGRG